MWQYPHQKEKMGSHGHALYFIFVFALSVIILTLFTATFTLIQAPGSVALSLRLIMKSFLRSFSPFR